MIRSRWTQTPGNRSKTFCNSVEDERRRRSTDGRAYSNEKRTQCGSFREDFEDKKDSQAEGSWQRETRLASEWARRSEWPGESGGIVETEARFGPAAGRNKGSKKDDEGANEREGCKSRKQRGEEQRSESSCNLNSCQAISSVGSVPILGAERSRILSEDEKAASMTCSNRCTGQRGYKGRVKSSITPECSKYCTASNTPKIKTRASPAGEQKEAAAEVSSQKASCSVGRSKEPAGPCERLKARMKEISRRAQDALPRLEKKARRAQKRMGELCGNLRARRAFGFNCDLKKCESTLMECSASGCKKPAMIFGEVKHRGGGKALGEASIDGSASTSRGSKDCENCRAKYRSKKAKRGKICKRSSRPDTCECLYDLEDINNVTK
ncbi:hypothetical protein KM043_004349 [Ampulex compressa]|nr:hypothetical protein KM043_004349 [Ampulex compressa]